MNKKLPLLDLKTIASTLSPGEKAALEARMHEFLAADFWTPAVGAMLVCGLMPPLDSVEICEGSVRFLIAPESVAEEKDLFLAHDVLGGWRFSEPWLVYLSDEERSLIGPGLPLDFDLTKEELEEDREHVIQKIRLWSTSISPHEFLSWCEDQCSDRSSLFLLKPKWLSYWIDLAFPRAERNGDELATVNDLEILSEKLGHLFEMKLRQRTIPATSADDKHNTFSEYVKKMEGAILTYGRLSIAPIVIKALKACANPQNPSAVFAQLHTWASQGSYPDIKPSEKKAEKAILIPGAKSPWKLFTQSALGQYLRRREEDAGLRVLPGKSVKTASKRDAQK